MLPHVPVKPSGPPSRARRKLPPLVAAARFGSQSSASAAEPEERASRTSPSTQAAASSSSSAPLLDEASERAARLQSVAVEAVKRLATIAPQLCLVLVQPEADCEEVRRVGFGAVWTSSNVGSRAASTPDLPQTFVGIVVLSLGDGIQECLGCVNALDELGNIPPCIVVLLRAGGQPSADFELECQESRAIFEAGSDDVMNLFDERELTPSRVMMSITRTEVMAGKAAEHVAEHVDKAKKKQSNKFKSLAGEFLWSLAGQVLESIPYRDETMEECVGEGNRLGPYELLYELGSGAFGVVFKAQHAETGTVRCLKVMSKKHIQTFWQMTSLDKELCILQNLAPHPNVIRAYEAIHTRGFIIMVMGFVGELNLHSYIVQTLKEQSWDNLPTPQIERFCQHAARGVAHLHSWQVCHRDIKPNNFIVSSDGKRLHLADFGFACRVVSGSHKLQSWCGSLPFIAPEVLRLREEPKSGVGYDGLASDVWSLGINFIEFGLGIFTIERLLGWTPSSPPKSEDQLQDLVMFPILYNSGPRIPVPRVARMIDYMLRLTPEDRVTMEWVLSKEGLDIAR